MGKQTEVKLTPARRLRTAISDDFGSYLISLGFERCKRSSHFYPYRRRSLRGYDLLDIQFDKYNRPKFVINFGFLPGNFLVDAYGRLVGADDVFVANLIQQGRLHKGFHSERWFGVGPLACLISAEDAVRREIRLLKESFKQVELWFQTREKGPNLSLRECPHNGPGVGRTSMIARGVWPPEGWTDADEEAVKKADQWLASDSSRAESTTI